MWVRRDGAFEPLVDRLLFDAAQVIVQERSRRLTDEEMLGALRGALSRRGYLSGLIIDEADDLPSSSAYQSRFGSLIRAYQLVGFTPDRDYRYIEVNRALRALHPELVSAVISGVTAAGGTVSQDAATDLLTVNGEFTVSIVLARHQQTQAGAGRWHIRLDLGLAPDITVAVRMDAENKAIKDYYLFPRRDVRLARLRLGETNEFSLDAFRFDTLVPLFAMAARTDILEVA